MSDRAPKGLPRGYRPIWQSLAEADAASRSRADLAREMGVSTHTLQRILVDGTPPDFRRAQSHRLVLSWVRTIARLARGLGHDPRTWIESVGIQWNEEIRAAATSDLTRRDRPAAPGVAAVAAAAVAVRAGALDRIRARAAEGDPEPVRAGVAPLGPYEPFLRAYVDRMVGAVDPAWGVRWVRASAEEIVEQLLDRHGLDLGVGLFETPHLRGRGLEFLPVPGCRPAVRALCVRPLGEAGPVPAWADLTEAAASGASTPAFLVRDGDPAASLVLRQWNVPPDRVVHRRRPTAAALADEVLAEARRRSAAVVLVADEITVRGALARLTATDGFAEELEALAIDPPPGEEPRYPLGVAAGSGDGLLPLLRHAETAELFGAARAATATLYADLILEGARGVLAENGGSAAVTGLVRTEAFPEAVPEFRRVVVRRLLATLAAEAPVAENAWGRAMDVARRVTPTEWRPALEQAGQALAGPAHPGPGLCRSCSASLLENRGVSDLYCRYCSDEEGRLRPREEVRKILADWMRAWQGGLTPEQSLERAERFMSTMPAWANN